VALALPVQNGRVALALPAQNGRVALALPVQNERGGRVALALPVQNERGVFGRVALPVQNERGVFDQHTGTARGTGGLRRMVWSCSEEYWQFQCHPAVDFDRSSFCVAQFA
jgi:hypothetical protein